MTINFDTTRIKYLIANTRHTVAKDKYRRQPNWVLVKYMFGVGSTVAHEICLFSGIAPDDTDVKL